MLKQLWNAYLSFVFIIVIVSPYEVYAVPASPVTRVLVQSSGDSFQARQWGDEHAHGWETLDGYTIIYDTSLKNWTYAVRANNGHLMGSGKRVSLDSLPNQLKQYLRPSRVSDVKSAPLGLPGGTPALSSGLPLNAAITSGTAYMPVILINFTDTAGTYQASGFQNLLFENTGTSFRNYYEEVSYGNYSVSPGPGGISGWHTSRRNHDYYGSNTNQMNDAYPGILVRDAVAAADDSGFDFSPYDMDGDCYVDVVSVVYQGRGEADGGSSTDIWPHYWNLNEADQDGRSDGPEFVTNDVCQDDSTQFVKVNGYILTPELAGDGNMTTIGIMAHEYGHALGLPDLYDTDGSSSGTGNWSLMSYGVYNYQTRSGDCPAHLDAWSKFFLGWVSPVLVDGILNQEVIDDAADHADVYQLLIGNPGPESTKEYFLIENRQKVKFDAGLPGNGLLVWHIDESKSSDGITDNNNECEYDGTSCETGHYRVGLVQADGHWDLERNNNYGDDGDPFPGSTGATNLSDSTVPDLSLYDGSPSGVSVMAIQESGLVITATLDGWVDGEAPTVPANVSAVASSSSVAISWDQSTDNREVKGYVIYRNGLKKDDVTLLTYTDQIYQVGTYCYAVLAYDGSGNDSELSDEVCVNVTEAPYMLSVIHPNGGESLVQNNGYQIAWSSNNIGNGVDIDLFKGGTAAENYFQTIVRSIYNDGAYSYSPSSDLEAGDDFYIRISAQNGLVVDFSDQPFTINNSPGESDDDGDGYTIDQGDCDDSNNMIHPHAEESCGDNIDHNCDGLDPECGSGGLDVDDDRDGYTENEGDCDDVNALIYPGAEDVCDDGVDQDCSGSDKSCTSDEYTMTGGDIMVLSISNGLLQMDKYTGRFDEDSTLLYGPVEIVVSRISVGGTINLTLEFSSALPQDAGLYMVINGIWFNVTPSSELNAERNEVLISLSDGGFGDTDESYNHEIVSRLGIAFPNETEIQNTEIVDEDSEEGCFIGTLDHVL